MRRWYANEHGEMVPSPVGENEPRMVYNHGDWYLEPREYGGSIRVDRRIIEEERAISLADASRRIRNQQELDYVRITNNSFGGASYTTAQGRNYGDTSTSST